MGVLTALMVREKMAWTWLMKHRQSIMGSFLFLGAGMAGLTVKSNWHGLMVSIGYTWIAAFYTSFLILALIYPVSRWKILSALAKLGGISYAVYIFHEGINWTYHAVFFNRPPTLDGWRSLGVTGAALLTTLALAETSWRLLESRLIRRAHARYRYVETATFAVVN